MPTVVTINSVTTGDAAPSTAPHRISAKPSKDTATFTFTPVHDGQAIPSESLIPPFTPGQPRPTIAVMIRDGGATPYSGTLVGRKGLVCSESEPCSESLACSDWESPSGTQLSEDVTYAEEGATPAEGAHTVNVWTNTYGEGWA
jgi:hypothetical protein